MGGETGIYVDRNDGNGYVFIEKESSHNRFSSLQLQEGKNTVKLSTITKATLSKNGETNNLHIEKNVAFWEFDYQASDFKQPREITVANSTFRMSADFNAYYAFYVDKHDGNGFVLVGGLQTWSRTYVQESIRWLGLTEALRYKLQLSLRSRLVRKNA